MSVVICSLFFVSALLVSLGQPAWIPELGFFSGACGFALFWKAMFYFPLKKHRFWMSLIWFALVQAIQLSWMTSTYYIGPFILPVYLLLLFLLGLQFAFLSLFLIPNQALSVRHYLAISGCWVLFEWSRIFFLTGFTWNPVGLVLTSSPYALQFASLFGVYGLSFWVILVNLVALNAFFILRTKSCQLLWLGLALIPYGFGWGHQAWVERYYAKSAKNVSVALIETGLSIEEKYGTINLSDKQICPLDQWVRVWNYLKTDVPLDLIVLPEGAFPGPAYNFYYDLEAVKVEWMKCFGEQACSSFPSLQSPLAFPYVQGHKIRWKVNHAFLAQALSNQFSADVVIGLDDDRAVLKYNSAFCFHPHALSPESHAKRILAPVGEYIPFAGFSWVGTFVETHFGISDSFDSGKIGTVFSAKVPIGIAICLEEVYSGIVRELRQNGAELLVSLSNDGWFPSSQLAQQHFDHGRVRSVENGVCLLRSSNMGVTGVIDPLGRVLERLPLPIIEGKALYFSLPVYSYPTLYSRWGDQAILFLSALFLCFFLCRPLCNTENLAPK